MAIIHKLVKAFEKRVDSAFYSRNPLRNSRVSKIDAEHPRKLNRLGCAYFDSKRGNTETISLL